MNSLNVSCRIPKKLNYTPPTIKIFNIGILFMGDYEPTSKVGVGSHCPQECIGGYHLEIHKFEDEQSIACYILVWIKKS